MYTLLLIWLTLVTLVKGPQLTAISVGSQGGKVAVTLHLNKRIKKVSHAPSESPLGIWIDLPNVNYTGNDKVIPGKNELLRVKIKESPKPFKGTRILLQLSRPAPYKFYNMGDQIKVVIGNENVKAKGLSLYLDEDNFFFYRSRAKRDPFYPLLEEEANEDTLLKVGSAILVGIIGEKSGNVALLKDASGRGYVLRKGDPVSSGRVIAVDDTSVTFLLNDFGIKRKVYLKLPTGQR